MLMTRKIELENQCKKIAAAYWGLDFNIPIVLNSRLRSHGRFRRNSIERIEISYAAYYTLSQEQLNKALKRLLCVWACYHMNKPFSEGSDFLQKELNRIGA